MILLILPYLFIAYALPFGLLVALPLWGSIRLRRRGHGWPLALLPLLVPVVTAASEAYPRWLVGEVAQEPLDIDARREAVQSLYAFGGDASGAARMAVKLPSLDYSEGVVEEVRRPGPRLTEWERIPPGYVRFRGRRAVEQAADCRADEASVVILGRGDPLPKTWFCTGWTSISASGASHEKELSTRRYEIGPFAVSETRNFVVRRSDRQPVNMLIGASIAGGIWWHVTEWLGEPTGFSALSGGNVLGPYSASTSDYLDGVSGEEFLVTGRRRSGEEAKPR